MTGDGLHQRTSAQGSSDLEVAFWSLVVLAKFLVFALGIGLILLTFTEYRTTGLLVMAIALLLGVRWIRIYRAAQADIGD